MRLLMLLRLTGRVLLMQPRILAWLPPLLWAAMIFALSSFTPRLDGLPLPSLGGMLQNLAHPGTFGVLALLIVPVLARRKGPGGFRWTALTPEAALWVVVIVTLYGVTDELHQSMVEGRDASLFDVLSDFVGAACTVAVIRYLGRADATSAGLRKRLLLGLLACIASAGAATAWSHAYGGGPWPF